MTEEITLVDNNIANFTINEKFEFLEEMASMVIHNVTPSLIVLGAGGLGKSHCVIKTIENNELYDSQYTFIKGYSTARGLYNTLYDNNGKLIIFDDCDSVLEDKVALNVLKSALDSYSVRTISWNAKMNRNDEYPQSFNFTGRVIFISNKSKKTIDGAILSRSLKVDLTMTSDEKIERMEYILPDIMPEYSIDVKQDALNFLSNNKDNGDLNIRTLIMVSKIRSYNAKKWEKIATFMLTQ